MPIFLPNRTDNRMGPAAGVRGSGITQARGWVWGVGASIGDFVAPAAGGAIDGVSCYFGGGSTALGHSCNLGQPTSVEAGGAFSAGADLETLADGRMVTRTTGRIVMRALEASAGAGDIVWASFRS